MYTISENVIWSEDKKNNSIKIILSPSGEYMETNKIGAEIWKLIDAGKDKSEIISELKENYKAPEFKIKIDVNIFIEKLISKNIFIT